MTDFDDDWTDAGDAGKGCGIWGLIVFGGAGILYFVLKEVFGIDLFAL